MAHAVLTTSVGSVYDDLPEFRYHFPRTYLNQVQAAVGDWIVYYEPRRSQGGGRQAYFAMARVLRVEADPDLQDHFYAYLDGYVEFDHPVGFQGQGNYWEAVSFRRPCLTLGNDRTAQGPEMLFAARGLLSGVVVGQPATSARATR